MQPSRPILIKQVISYYTVAWESQTLGLYFKFDRRIQNLPPVLLWKIRYISWWTFEWHSFHQSQVTVTFQKRNWADGCMAPPTPCQSHLNVARGMTWISISRAELQFWTDKWLWYSSQSQSMKYFSQMQLIWHEKGEHFAVLSMEFHNIWRVWQANTGPSWNSPLHNNVVLFKFSGHWS